MTQPTNSSEEDEKLLIFGWICAVFGLPTDTDPTKYNELADKIYDYIQAWYLSKQSVIDAIGEDEYVGNPHHERFVGASWSNELRKEIRQKLNLHDNQQIIDSDTTVGNKRSES